MASQAAGSAYVELGNTKVMVAVYGPRPTERKFGFAETGRLHCEVRFTPFGNRALRTRLDTQAAERSYGTALGTALEASVQLDKFPKSAVDVYGMVLESGGSDVAALITAASMALADAHIELLDVVTACSVALVKGNLLLDPSGQEEARQAGGLVLAMMPSRNEVTQMQLTGDFSGPQTSQALQLAMGGCMQLKQLVHSTLSQAVAAAFEQS